MESDMGNHSLHAQPTWAGPTSGVHLLVDAQYVHSVSISLARSWTGEIVKWVGYLPGIE